jgi:hypothetical protein
MRRPSLWPAPLLVAASCLGPRVSDEVSGAELLLPASAAASVPSIYDTDDGEAIEANQGVPTLIPLLSGFAAGAPVRFWDFGPAPDHVAPLFRLAQRNGDTLTPLPHPPIFTAVPGDRGYSPYWTVFLVEVTAAYQGQLITSQQALDEARARGLVLAPKAAPVNVNCPIVTPDIRLEVGGGKPALAPDHVFYYEGHQGVYFELGASHLGPDNVSVPTTDLFQLRHEGGEPVSEPVRHVDLDGDGDTSDTNDVFARRVGDDAWSPRCQVVDVVVNGTTALIDRSQSDTVSDVRAASDLFTGDQPTARVVAYDRSTRFFNCAMQTTAGGL